MNEASGDKQPVSPKRRSIMARLGLERPPHYNGMIGWFEIFATAWVSYGLFWGCVVAWNHQSVAFLGFPVLTALALYLLIMLTTRRAYAAAYWICLALLMGPSIKLARKFSGMSLEAITAQPLGIWLGAVFSLGAALLLLHPANRLWIALRRLELKRAKESREIVQFHLYDPKTEDDTLRRMLLVIEPERVIFTEMVAELPEQGWREWNTEHLLAVEDKDTVPLVVVLRKAAKIHALPKGNLNTVLKESAEAALKPKMPLLRDICQFLTDNRISWKTAIRDYKEPKYYAIIAGFDGETRKLTQYLKDA